MRDLTQHLTTRADDNHAPPVSASRRKILFPFHVERIDDMALYDGDFEAAKAAEQDGVRLIYGMDGIPDGIYIDTPENRELIRKGLGLYPDYRNWRDDFDPSFVAELDVMQ